MNKSVIFTMFSLLFLCSEVSFASGVDSQTMHDCNILGCRVKCAYEKNDWQLVGEAEKVSITIFNSGVTKFELLNAMSGTKTVVMGGSGYICIMENQKN